MAVPKKRRSKAKSKFSKLNWNKKISKIVYNSYSLGVSKLKNCYKIIRKNKN
jgi:hypothetical protein